MGRVIQFEERAVAHLRERLGVIEEANQDLIAFARGHPLFGRACDLIRAEALTRIDCEPPFPSGIIALGQRTSQSLDARHGSELLMFLGRSLGAMIRRWLIDPPQPTN